MSIHEPLASAVSAGDLTELAASVAGPVIPRGHPDMAAEVATFNLAITHDPAVAVGATCAADVAATVAWAAARGIPVAVQGGAHGPVQRVCDAVVLTTSRMAGVRVDPARRTARIAAGTRWSEVQEAAEPHGLAAVSGSSSHVGVIGFTVGGGMGPLSRQFGFGADRVLSLDLVTADGVIRQVDELHDADLFWAVRGGKGNFGIVTAMEIELVPIATVYGGAVFFDAASAADVLHSFRTWAPTLPDHAGTSVAMLRLPPVEELPEQIRGRYVVQLRFSLNGSEEEGIELLAPMLASGHVLLDGVQALPVTGLDAIHQDPTDPMPVWERGGLLASLPAAAVEALLEVAGPESPGDLAMVELRLMGGALARQPRVANAVAGREGAYSVFTLAVVAPDAEDGAPAAGLAVHEALAPWSTGTAPVNWLGDATTPEQVARAWRPEVHARLLEVKERFDPANLFRFGHALV